MVTGIFQADRLGEGTKVLVPGGFLLTLQHHGLYNWNSRIKTAQAGVAQWFELGLQTKGSPV